MRILAMPYAIMQTNLDVPPVDSLKRAFRQVPFLTEIDAFTIARDAFGILVKNLTAEQASQLQGALRGQGIETEQVEMSLLPALPPGKLMRQFDVLPDALQLFDPLGQPFLLEWRHLLMIAAGQVRLTEFERVERSRPVTRYNSQGLDYTFEEKDYSTREVQRDHLILEIVIAGAALRYTVDGGTFNYQCLRQRRRPDAEGNFALVVQDLVRAAPQATLNRGAYYLRERQATPFTYPSRNAFQEELIWLLWHLKQRQARTP